MQAARELAIGSWADRESAVGGCILTSRDDKSFPASCLVGHIFSLQLISV